MAVIGQKGTYAKVEAPRDYLGNALANIERTNSAYREEKRQQEELKQAQLASAEQAQIDRNDKAFEKSREFKGQDYGNNRMNESSNKVVSQMANEVASIYSKRNRTPEDNARLTQLYSGLDSMKNTATTLKSFITDKSKEVSEGVINTDGNDPIPSLLNIDKGELFIDESGKMSAKVLDPETGNETIISLDKLGDRTYLESLMPKRVDILGKEGILNQIKSNITPQEHEKNEGGKIIKIRDITPEQELASKELITTSIGSNPKRILDAAKQLNIPYKEGNTPEELKQTSDKIADKIFNQAKLDFNLADDSKTDYEAIRIANQKSKEKYDRWFDKYKFNKTNSDEGGGNGDKIKITVTEDDFGKKISYVKKVTPEELQNLLEQEAMKEQPKQIEWSINPIQSGYDKASKQAPAIKFDSKGNIIM